MTTTIKRPPRLPIRFYVWLRNNNAEIARRLQANYATAAVIDGLEWGTKSDVPMAKELLTQFEKEIAEGNWTGVEKVLFGIYPYYESLPSFKRGLHSLKVKDPRATGKPPAPRKARKSRPKGGVAVSGQPARTAPAPAPSVPSATAPASASTRPVAPQPAKPQAPKAGPFEENERV